MLNYLVQKVKLAEIAQTLRYPEGEVLIIVPPFARLVYPPLAAHLLQGSAAQAGYKVSVFYANLHLAALIGTRKYRAISEALPLFMAASRLFAPQAYEIPANDDLFDLAQVVANLIGKQGRVWRELLQIPIERTLAELDLMTMRSLAEEIGHWVDDVAAAVAGLSFDVIGCTSTFEQTGASVALLRQVKRQDPQKITIIGGSNCEGEMAEGVAGLSHAIDYVFRGEGEVALVDFLDGLKRGQRPLERIISGRAQASLENLPRPEYQEYFDQFHLFLPRLAHLQDQIQLSYETSRGCWWGQKTVCTFCGLNGEQLSFRQKAPDQAVEDLLAMYGQYPTTKFYMVDTIMPYNFFKTFLPQLAAEFPADAEIFYEEKSNLTLQQVITLHQAGVRSIQPGIEALSSSLLKRMRKGVSARQNIALLRYGRSVGLDLVWNLLVGFPGDLPAEYEETLRLLPLLQHLQPPFLNVLWPVTIQRFSAYFEHPEQYGLANMRPYSGYEAVLPAHCDARKTAYFFTADYPSAAYDDPELVYTLGRELTRWTEAWATGSKPPRLDVQDLKDGRYLLRDTRNLPGGGQEIVLDRRQASQVMTAAPLSKAENMEWALQRKIAVVLDGWYVPLATAEPGLLAILEGGGRMEQLILRVNSEASMEKT